MYESKDIYLVEGLVHLDIDDIGLAKIKSRHLTMRTNIQPQPTITIDCNNNIHVMGISQTDPVAAVINFLNKWVQYGFIIVSVEAGQHLVQK